MLEYSPNFAEKICDPYGIYTRHLVKELGINQENFILKQ
jgi:hypothetical protein